MDEPERRKHARIDIRNLISHDSITRKGQIVSSNMGRALNVSRSGILLETARPIDEEFVSIFAVDLENKLIELKGRPIHCRKTQSGTYHAGIEFTGSEDEKAMFAVKLIKLFFHRKYKMRVQVAA
jgi:hypothetical protein